MRSRSGRSFRLALSLLLLAVARADAQQVGGAEQRGLLLEQGEHVARLGVTGGAAGDTGDLAGIFQLEGELDPSTCPAAEEAYSTTKVKEGAARQAELEALERSTGQDIDLDGVVGR